jgi:hypothetical protein
MIIYKIILLIVGLIMGWFTGKALSRLINGTKTNNFTMTIFILCSLVVGIGFLVNPIKYFMDLMLFVVFISVMAIPFQNKV